MDWRIISIGALAAHPLWGEKAPVRTGHATTTLIRSGERVILVDPGLPEQALVARLSERAGLRAKDVTHVFLTSFRPDLRRGIMAFEHATWWISEAEREGFGLPLLTKLREAAEIGDASMQEALEAEVAVLKKCEAAPDHLAERVDLFPLPGVTPGLCGLLLPGPRFTALVCGDAVPTVEHLEQGKVLTTAADVNAARESFSEAVEIADLLIPGRDNVIVNPGKKLF
jgi:glyoxylase-like metal-dependent hydrolase (beta-lactamase superfamily II)